MAQDPGSFPQPPHQPKDPGKNNAFPVVLVVIALGVLGVLVALLLLGGFGFFFWRTTAGPPPPTMIAAPAR